MYAMSNLAEMLIQRHGLKPESVVDFVLWQSVPKRVEWLARFLYSLDRDWFADDVQMIQSVLQAGSVRDVQVEVSSYRYYHPPSGFFRGWLRVRASGQQLLTVAMDAFEAKTA